MKTKNNSFIRLCLIQFAIYALIITSICIITNVVVNYKLNNSFLILDNFLVNEEKLIDEDYKSINMKRFLNCDYAVYDENNKLVYTTDKAINDVVNGDEIELISDYHDNNYYNIINYKDKNNVVYYKVYLTLYDYDTDTEIVEGYVKLNSDYEIVEGDLFPDREYLTKEELDLMRGIYNKNRSIEKYGYENSDGDKRTLLFMAPEFNTKEYDLVVKNSQKIWCVSIPLIIILIILETWIFNKKIKKSINILNDVINSYNENNKKCNTDKLPGEFMQVVDNFDNLVTKLKMIEEEKYKSYQEKQKIITDLSHDLKTPLTVIQGYSKAFLDNIVPDEKKNLYMEAIYSKSVVATDLINDLFMYVRMEHPEYNLKKQNINICEITKEYLAEKYNELELSNVELEVNIPDKEIMANIDEAAFRRIYDNLINNSIKYNPSGTKIYFEIKENKNNISIFIGDNGVGIDKNISDNLFDAFVTSNEARTSGKGSGLGMAIVKKLVLLHDGSIELIKKPQKGLNTEFLIILKKN